MDASFQVNQWTTDILITMDYDDYHAGTVELWNNDSFFELTCSSDY